MDIFQKLYEIENETGGDVSGIKKLIEDGQVTIASSMPSPDPKDSVREIALFNRFNKDYPNYADGGMLVKPSADGSRPGYSGVAENIYLNKDGTSYNVVVQAKNKPIYKSFNFSGYDKKYKNKTEALNAAKKFRDENKKGQIKKFFQDKEKLKVANQYANLLNKLNPKDKNYVSANKYLDITDNMQRQKIIQIMKANDFKFTKNYSKQQRFPANKEKLLMEAFNLTEDDFLKHGKYGIPIRVGNKENPMMSPIRTFINKGFKFRKPKKSEILTLDQQEFIKNNFELPEGKEWNFKSLKNPSGFKYGVATDKKSGTKSLYKRIRNRINDKNLSYTVAADRSSPEGWMMNSMNRLYENEIKNKVKFENLTYQPIKDKKGTIIGFKDNTAAGGNNTYYGLKKNTPEDATAWTAHGDYERINKFLNIAKGAQVDDPSELLQKILDDKGITKLLGEKRTLTLNDILSHERYFDKLSQTSPKSLIERQIVLHHTKRVGGDVAQAAATKDLQLLKSVVNAKIQSFESTALKRKLKPDEIKQLKNYGAKITDFDGKVVGGGYLDPDKQFASIEKGAIEYAKSDKFNIKTVASYLERLGCGKAAGGRVYFNEGAMGLTKCAKEGKRKLENIVKKGAVAGSGDEILARQILKIGSSLKDSFTLRGMFGPAAMAFLIGTEAGFVGYDMLTKGKTMREAVGDSLFNYMLGEKTKINPQEELFKRYRSLGYDDNQMFRLMETIRTTNLINRGKDIDQRAKAQAQYVQGLRNEPDQFMGPDDQMMSDTRSEMAEQKLKDIEQEAIDYNKFLEQVDRPGGMKKEDAIAQYFRSGEYAKGLELVDEADAAATVQKMQSPGPTSAGFLSPKFEAYRQRTIAENLPGGGVNPAALLGIQAYEDPSSLPDNFRIIPMQPYGLANGGIAGLSGGVDKGPPPARGPNPQGLSYLMKRGKNT